MNFMIENALQYFAFVAMIFIGGLIYVVIATFYEKTNDAFVKTKTGLKLNKKIHDNKVKRAEKLINEKRK
jgi:hypothetical protein